MKKFGGSFFSKFAVIAFALTLISCIPALGQVIKGSISGSVTDEQGAVVSGAQIKATEINTGAVFNTTSDSSGVFRVSLIPAGSYKVETSAQGFKTAVQNNVAVTAGSDTGLGIMKLTVGGTSETVEVTATTPLVETTQSQVTNTFSGVELQSFTGVQEAQGLDNLALFVPGVSNTRDNTFSNTNGVGFSVDGLRGRNNDQQIDGQNNNDNSVGGPGLFLFDTDFVQQYVLVTNQFGPEYGRNAGSVVNIITKSGTNNWHGSLYGNENNSVLNSLTSEEKDFESLSGVPRLNNEFGGGTIGGPIVKNKAFIFGGFDQQLISTNTIYTSGFVAPTPTGLTQLNSCFPGSSSLAAYNSFGPYAISAGNPTPIGSVTPVNVGSCASVPFSTLERTLPTPFHGFNFLLRADVQLGGDTLASRYIFNRGNTFNSDPGDNGAEIGYPINVTGLSQDFLESWTHNFGAHMVNELRGSFGRLNVDFGGNKIGNTVPTENGLANAVTEGFFDPGSGFLQSFGAPDNIPQGRIVNTWQAQDNWNYVLGKHNIKAGVNWTYQRSPNTFLPFIDGGYRFTDWTNFVANTPDQVNIAEGPSSLDFREYDTFLYAGDDWKISQNLTLNLGLTWTYYGQPANLFNQLTTAQQTGPNPFWNPALPLSVTTAPTIPAPSKNFGPSAGFAYNPHWGGFLTGNGRTTIRGGFRFLYDPPFYNVYLNNATSAPNVFLDTFNSTTTTPASSLPVPAVPTGPNVRASLSPFLTPGVLDPRTQDETQISSNFGPDKVETWSFGIEREVSKNSAFEVRYTGNHAYDLFQSVNGNPFVGDLATDFPNALPAGFTPCPASQAVVPEAIGRANCNEGIVRLRDNGGFSNYQAVQAEYRTSNLFKQLTMRMAYTYSKTLDNVSEIFDTVGGGNTVAFSQNPTQPGRPEYSLSGLNIPNQFSVILTEQLPFWKEQHGFMGHLLGGWSFSGSYIYATGEPYTPTQVSAAITDAVAGKDYFDSQFLGAFNGGLDAARPFLGSASAPITSVGMFAGDACVIFGAGCSLAANQLLSVNAINQGQGAVAINQNQVRFIVNGFEAQQVFGTPFGNVARNTVQDAPTNISNISIYKQIKLGERAAFEFHTTFLNAFNQSNFTSVDPVLEDAGNAGFFNGFGNPSLTNNVTPGNVAGTRQIFFGGKITF